MCLKEDRASGGLHGSLFRACTMEHICVEGLVNAKEGLNPVRQCSESLPLQRIMKRYEVILSLGFLFQTNFSWQEGDSERGKLMALDYDGIFALGDNIRGILYLFYDGSMLVYCYNVKIWVSSKYSTCNSIPLALVANSILDLCTMDSSSGFEAGSDACIRQLEK